MPAVEVSCEQTVDWMVLSYCESGSRGVGVGILGRADNGHKGRAGGWAREGGSLSGSDRKGRI